ncbi:hypothetical protein E2562_003633 [Oryza meyeriana var. granulata]|uniref:Uncharacterized protein n=1 Tax=Oryza meyeriana var. granulata TaxID=110450 RepID=A0A6G1CPE6_9ORYZ|nr:hypothetical protein E2562_003633 [Oryza meyeriana var. granulata]
MKWRSRQHQWHGSLAGGGLRRLERKVDTGNIMAAMVGACQRLWQQGRIPGDSLHGWKWLELGWVEMALTDDHETNKSGR